MKVPDVIKEAARELRKNMTRAEQELWKNIRRDISGYRFLRQKPLYVFTEDSGLDRFVIPDFYCHVKKLIIEVDGSVHNKLEVCCLDKEKELLLQKQWIAVLRLENDEIMNNIDVAMQKIIEELSK